MREVLAPEVRNRREACRGTLSPINGALHLPKRCPSALGVLQPGNRDSCAVAAAQGCAATASLEQALRLSQLCFEQRVYGRVGVHLGLRGAGQAISPMSRARSE